AGIKNFADRRSLRIDGLGRDENQEVLLVQFVAVVAEKAADERKIAQDRNMVMRAVGGRRQEAADAEGVSVLQGDLGQSLAGLNDGNGSATCTAEIDRTGRAADLRSEGELDKALRIHLGRDLQYNSDVLVFEAAHLKGSGLLIKLITGDGIFLANIDKRLGVVQRNNGRIGNKLGAVIGLQCAQDELKLRRSEGRGGRATRVKQPIECVANLGPRGGNCVEHRSLGANGVSIQ